MKSIAVAFVATLIAFVSASPPSPPTPPVFLDGKCPNIPALEDFDLAKFSGRWFIFKETNPIAPCAYFDISKVDEENLSAVKQPENNTVVLHKISKNTFADGFVLKSESSLLNGDTMKLYSTDYENYAAGFVCKEVENKHFLIIGLWSRKTTLDEKHLNLMKQATEKYDYLKKVVLKDNNFEGCKF